MPYSKRKIGIQKLENLFIKRIISRTCHTNLKDDHTAFRHLRVILESNYEL